MQRPHWIRKPPALPVEVARRKALALSIERSEQQIEALIKELATSRTLITRLRAVGQKMQAK